MLSAVAENAPQIYRFCHLAYDNRSLLKFSTREIFSDEGIQQGDPLGPLLFCMAIHPLMLSCKSPLKIAYMDDITLGGAAAVVSDDVAMIKTEGTPKGLFLNVNKCEAITNSGQSTVDLLQNFTTYTFICDAPRGTAGHRFSNGYLLEQTL
jgi:hypothetical protein